MSVTMFHAAVARIDPDRELQRRPAWREAYDREHDWRCRGVAAIQREMEYRIAVRLEQFDEKPRARERR